MKFLFVTAIAFFSMTMIYAQGKTTWEEFHYVNRALASDQHTGRGIKTGYTVDPISEESVLKWKDGTNRAVRIFVFRKGVENRAMILRCSDNKGGDSYYCFPTIDSDAEMWKQAYLNFEKFPKEWHQVISWGLLKLLSSKMPKS